MRDIVRCNIVKQRVAILATLNDKPYARPRCWQSSQRPRQSISSGTQENRDKALIAPEVQSNDFSYVFPQILNQEERKHGLELDF